MLVTNHAPYITETLTETVNERSYLENLCLKKQTPESIKKYKKQKNFCSKLYKKKRRKHFEVP